MSFWFYSVLSLFFFLRYWGKKDTKKASLVLDVSSSDLPMLLTTFTISKELLIVLQALRSTLREGTPGHMDHRSSTALLGCSF